MPKYQAKFQALHEVTITADDLNNAELLFDNWVRDHIKWEVKKLSIIRTDPGPDDTCPDCKEKEEKSIPTPQLLLTGPTEPEAA